MADLPLPEGYPYRGVRITPAPRQRGAVLGGAAGAVFEIPKSKDLLVTANSVDEFEGFLERHPEAVAGQKEVWCLDSLVPESEPEQAPKMSGFAVRLDDEYALGGMEAVYLYDDRDAALADLARRHERVGLVWAVWQEGAPANKALARAALDGDPSALGVLADALEEAGDPRGGVVRGWLKEENKMPDTVDWMYHRRG